MISKLGQFIELCLHDTTTWDILNRTGPTRDIHFNNTHPRQHELINPNRLQYRIMLGDRDLLNSIHQLVECQNQDKICVKTKPFFYKRDYRRPRSSHIFNWITY